MSLGHFPDIRDLHRGMRRGAHTELEQPPPVVIVPARKGRHFLLPRRPLWVRVSEMGVQRVVCGLMDEPDPPARSPLPATVHLDPPVVVAVPDSVLAKPRYLLLLRYGRWMPGVAMQVPPGKHVLEADDVAVPNGLPDLMVLRLAMGSLRAPEVVVVGPLERGDLLLTRGVTMPIVERPPPSISSRAMPSRSAFRSAHFEWNN